MADGDGDQGRRQPRRGESGFEGDRRADAPAQPAALSPSDPALRRRLERGLDTLGIALDPGAVDQLLAYLDLLRRWSKTYNLTAVRAPEDMVARHLLDALAVLPHVRAAPLLDVGTGAGLPGLPLAIARPDWLVTLLDGAGKKIRFLNHVVRQLGLENVRPVHERAEDHRPDPLPATITTRAFASLADSWAVLAHLFGPGTRWLALKGRRPDAELAALPEAAAVESVIELAVPDLHAPRHLVIIGRHSSP